MTQRPESVTVVAWVVIVFSSFGVLSIPLAWAMRDWPMMAPMLTQYRAPYSVVMLVAAINVIVHLLCAVAWLWRQGWTRHVYVVTAVAILGYSLWVTPWPMFVLPSFAYSVGVAVALYRPTANRWFAGEAQATD